MVIKRKYQFFLQTSAKLPICAQISIHLINTSQRVIMLYTTESSARDHASAQQMVLHTRPCRRWVKKTFGCVCPRVSLDMSFFCRMIKLGHLISHSVISLGETFVFCHKMSRTYSSLLPWLSDIILPINRSHGHKSLNCGLTNMFTQTISLSVVRKYSSFSAKYELVLRLHAQTKLFSCILYSIPCLKISFILINSICSCVAI